MITSIAGGGWVAPSPSELPDLRIQMCNRVLREPDSVQFAVRITAGSNPLVPSVTGPPEHAVAAEIVGGVLMARCEQRRLSQAELTGWTRT